MVSLFPYGCGIFRFFEIEPEEIDEILEDIIERHHATFGSELEANQAIAEFRSELSRTRQAYPGIEDRIASLEKSSVEIEERLLHELTRRQVTNASGIVQRLMFGDQTLAPTLLPAEESLGLISCELVSEGASIFRQINPETLFARDEGWEGWCLDHLERWRGLYLSADEKNEAILVGVA
ncbi:hypothetical protein BWI75_20820 [Gloeocapsopsis sp. AAB1 = 1H9]|uniref:Uncharacterized protein n=2 Tax=Gloeocapsopsis TaxID=693222 RepID=A0A6N8G327_9CHRO|nr:hypothetical protein [Gloeocapsopsis dulcis AAB1 = 1H9]